MNEMIPVSYKNDRPTVLGRDLHAALGISTRYNDWFPRMCEYGFIEGVDFNLLKSEQVQIEGSREVRRELVDHQLTIDMAKQLCMIQRTELGHRYRQYFLELEKQWNSPEAIMARAHQLAEERIRLLCGENLRLTEKVAVQEQQIAEMKPKETYYNLVLMCKNAVPITIIAKDYGWSAKHMNAFLHEQKVQYRVRNTWVLYEKYAHNGYTDTKTFPIPSRDGESFRSETHTYWTQAGRLFIYQLMKDHGFLPTIEQEDAA